MPITNHNLDPKTGPKAKLWISKDGSVRPYLGGDVKDAQYITGALGIAWFPEQTLSFEFGYRGILYTNDSFKRYDEEDSVEGLEDAPSVIYLGGVWIF